MAIASFDVDPQKGFTPLCPNELPVPDGHAIVSELNYMAQFASYRVSSRDWHPINPLWKATAENPQFKPTNNPNWDTFWNMHCVGGTYGAEFLDGLPAPQEYDFTVYKGLEPNMHPYGACYHDPANTQSTGVIEFLKSKDVTEVLVGGLALDYCVKTTALQLQAAGFYVYVYLPACRSINPNLEEVIASFGNRRKLGFIDRAYLEYAFPKREERNG